MKEIDKCLEFGRECANKMFEGCIAELVSLMNRTACLGKEVFLKELISFSSTRLEVREGERMDDDSNHIDGEELSISVLFDKEKHRLTVEDSGIEITEDNLGMRPKQGTKALISSLKAGKDLKNIKLFDVGFFTVFAVADKVMICSTHSGRTELYTWESCAMERGFTIMYTESDQSESSSRTQVILDLKTDIAENIKRIGMEKFLREHNCHSSYKIKVFEYSVINGSEEGCTEPKKEAAVVSKDLCKGLQSTPGMSKGRKKSSKHGHKTKKSSSTTAPAVSGPSPKGLPSIPVPAPTQRFNAPGTSTQSNEEKMPPGMVSPANPGPAKAGVLPDPPAGPSFSTPSSVPARKFYAHGTGQMVSPTIQNPSGARVPSGSGSVKIKSPDNQSKGTKRKSPGQNPHETPKSRKSSISPDLLAIPAVVTAHRQNELGKGANTPFRDFTNLESMTLKTPGCAKTPGGTSRTSMPSSRNSPLVPNENSISQLKSVKNQIDRNCTIAVKVMKQLEQGKVNLEAGGKSWYRGSYEIVDSTDRATLKVYGDQDMRYFQPRQCLLLHVWIREGHIALTKRGKVEKYAGEIKTVEDIVKKRRSDEAKNRRTLQEIKSLGQKAAARVHISQVGDIHPFRNKDGSETVLRKLQVKDKKNSADIYELVTFHDIAKVPFQVNKRYLFDSIIYCHEKGNFQTTGCTLPMIVPLRRENDTATQRVCQQPCE